VKQANVKRVIGGEVNPPDWTELGRRIREVAAMAAEIHLAPSANVRGRRSLMRHPRIVGVRES